MYLGIDIGGTKTLVACLDAHGVIQERIKFPTPPLYHDFIKEIDKIVEQLTTKTFIAATVAAPGRIDREKGIAVAFGNLPWVNVPLVKDIKKILSCPVLIEHDAKLAGLSEAMLVKHQYNRVLYITISTGIGTGIIINQKIDPSFVNTEGGHMMLEHGGKMLSWEAFASGSAIVKRFGKKAKDIVDDHTWKIIAHDIAIGLIDLIAVIQPEVIIFGGSVGGYFERFKPFLEAELRQYETPLTPIPPLMKAGRPDDAVVYGCYDLAKERYG